jgi:hypothetical protein
MTCLLVLPLLTKERPALSAVEGVGVRLPKLTADGY